MAWSAEEHLNSLTLQRDTAWSDSITHARAEMRRTKLTETDIHAISDHLVRLLQTPEAAHNEAADIITHLDGTRIGALIGAMDGIALDMMEIDPDHPLQQMARPGVDINESLRLTPEERAECNNTLREMGGILEQAKNGSVYEQIAAVTVEIALGMHYQQKQVASRGRGR